MYMPTSPAYGLSTLHGESVVVQSVAVDVVLNDLLCETVITQTYRNLEKEPIEAVYTFPLAGQAVLLDLAVTIGERKLRGQVVKKSTAEEQYEEAVAQGDAAIMLEQALPGLYIMNVGNILAGEQVVVTIKTAELHTWNENTLRFLLPTTIAPRYGDPEKAGLQPHQIPEANLLTEHRFQLTLSLTGVLAQAQLECPSHQVAISTGTTTTTVQLAAGEACMDRDFILTLRLPQTPPDTLRIDHDLVDGWVALASFVPQLPPPQNLPPKSIKIVVDCSGSMAGDSISQARQAVSDILSLLRAEDSFNIILFGTTHRQLFDRQVPATSEHITKVRRLLRTIEADMGGTEMQEALLATVEIPGPAIPQDILLITDGEIWETEKLVAVMRRKAHRVFAVGVGSAVAEDVLRCLAQETGGACELVSPQEGMAEKIVRHFQRILLPKSDTVTVRWPSKPTQVIPDVFGPVFHGDTLHVFARFPSPPTGPVSLEMCLEDGRSMTQTIHPDNPPSANHITTTQPSALARMAIARGLKDQDEATAAELAVLYQLVSPYTNILVVDVRGEENKGKNLPVLRKVPQMLAAGWGGTGSVSSSQDVRFSIARPSACVDEPSVMYSPTAPPRDDEIFFSVGLSQEEIEERRQRTTPSAFMYECDLRNGRTTTWWKAELQLSTYDDLLACDLPDHILDALTDIEEQIEPPPSEAQVVLAFLLVLHETAQDCRFNRTTARSLKKARKKLKPSQVLLDRIKNTFPNISRESWGVSNLSLDETEIDREDE